PRIAVGPDGAVAVAYAHGTSAIDVATLAPGATRWRCRLLIGPGPDACLATPRVKRRPTRQPTRVPEALRFLPDGRLVVVWHERLAGVGPLYLASRARGAAAWSRPELLDRSAAVNPPTRPLDARQHGRALAVQLAADR